MTAPISNHDSLITRRNVFIGAAASLICAPAIVRTAKFNAGAPLGRTDWASVCRVLRTLILPLARRQLESRPNEYGSQRENNY